MKKPITRKRYFFNLLTSQGWVVLSILILGKYVPYWNIPRWLLDAVLAGFILSCGLSLINLLHAFTNKE